MSTPFGSDYPLDQDVWAEGGNAEPSPFQDAESDTEKCQQEAAAEDEALSNIGNAPPEMCGDGANVAEDPGMNDKPAEPDWAPLVDLARQTDMEGLSTFATGPQQEVGDAGSTEFGKMPSIQAPPVDDWQMGELPVGDIPPDQDDQVRSASPEMTPQLGSLDPKTRKIRDDARANAQARRMPEGPSVVGSDGSAEETDDDGRKHSDGGQERRWGEGEGDDGSVVSDDSAAEPDWALIEPLGEVREQVEQFVVGVAWKMIESVGKEIAKAHFGPAAVTVAEIAIAGWKWLQLLDKGGSIVIEGKVSLVEYVEVNVPVTLGDDRSGLGVPHLSPGDGTPAGAFAVGVSPAPDSVDVEHESPAVPQEWFRVDQSIRDWVRERLPSGRRASLPTVTAGRPERVRVEADTADVDVPVSLVVTDVCPLFDRNGRVVAVVVRLDLEVLRGLLENPARRLAVLRRLAEQGLVRRVRIDHPAARVALVVGFDRGWSAGYGCAWLVPSERPDDAAGPIGQPSRPIDDPRESSPEAVRRSWPGM
jgi:hypothetical protein